MTLRMEEQSRAVDNVRVLYLAVEAMRLNERRGISDVIKTAYLELDPPTQQIDPYELLEIRPGASVEVAEAVYLQEHIDTTTSGGKLIFHMFAMLAEFERNLIRERTMAGLAAARARGKARGTAWPKRGEGTPAGHTGGGQNKLRSEYLPDTSHLTGDVLPVLVILAEVLSLPERVPLHPEGQRR